ncbi:hypothetical protein FNF29_01124 [Cafeteria roenbergensis]|uniref:E3 ubiquitin-protein ligase synoviolin-like TPR repeats domain-containing protein n=1 Tax=Cafeteria roenbergensis TaxID=33653 RepID=A0A5A8DSL9_CAFRO|nr:hypothetical protein FNF29_01124 [Cafeteria roenbergensis]KAA0166482.1 hypothetical protein FNF28_03123 [Cafeteria roenbergensis]KAA0168436.1 hypothetical protein FNF31_00318 [Cafeteria roenbergensis]|eukprot:KAA0156331.1 hypothetical protein FNF29_01124 [Cafeteria roenbergensis]
MASERSVPTRTYIAFSIATILAAWVLATAQALMNPIEELGLLLHAWALVMTNPIGVAILINAVAAASLLLFQGLVGFVLGGMQGDEAAVCRRRALSFFFYKLAMTGFVLDLALDLDTLTMSPWLASLVLVVALTAVARRRRERLSPQRFSWATHGASVIFTLVAMAVNTAVLLFWASMLLEGGISLALLLLVDCFLEGLSLAHALARTAIEAYDAWVSPPPAASAGDDGEGSDAAASQGWQGKVTATLLVDFIADAGGLVLTLVHYLHVWWTAGFNFSLLDVLLFLNCRAVVIQLRDRYAEHLEFYRRSDSLRAALAAMHVPTEREIREEDAVCGIMQVARGRRP